MRGEISSVPQPLWGDERERWSVQTRPLHKVLTHHLRTIVAQYVPLKIGLSFLAGKSHLSAAIRVTKEHLTTVFQNDVIAQVGQRGF